MPRTKRSGVTRRAAVAATRALDLGVGARATTTGRREREQVWHVRLLLLVLVLLVARVGHLLRADLGRGEVGRVAALGLELLDLRLDPVEGVAEALLERRRRRPAEDLLDEGVVRVAAAHALGAPM